MGKRLIDETGKHYGNLTVLKRVTNEKGQGAWLCSCDCGNTRLAQGSDLRFGRITTCGQSGCKCKQSRNVAFIDETGNKYGRLLVIRRDEQKTLSNKTLWVCKCDCGTQEISVTGESLRNGTTQSCGCLQKEAVSQKRRLDLNNQRFGKLTVVSCTNKQDNTGNVLWLCKCDCGSLKEVSAHSLVSGNTKSCGCLLSKNELLIKEILDELNINYQPQYSFSEFYSPKGSVYRFDFAILDKHKSLLGLIEFHGIQHYEPVEFFGGQEAYQIRVQYDFEKNQYCKKHGIPLLILSDKTINIKNSIIEFYERINLYD